jgi:hypothetical protein
MSLFDDAPLTTNSVRHETIIRDVGKVIAVHPAQFTPVLPDTDDVYVSEIGEKIMASADNITFVCPLTLPDGAKITSAIVRGNSAASAETWALVKFTRASGGTVTIASGNINTRDSSITEPVIDNADSSYCFTTSSLDTNDEIHGGKIMIAYD